MTLSEFLQTQPQESIRLLSFARDEKGDFRFRLEGSTRFEVTLKGVSEAEILFERGQKELFRLEESLEDALLWDYGQFYEIYGDAPVADPIKFFFDFLQGVRFDLKLARDPARYLNWKKDYKEWVNFTYQRAYHLMTAPKPLTDLATKILDAQAIEHNVLTGPDLSDDKQRSAVWIGPSWFVVEEAEVKLASSS